MEAILFIVAVAFIVMFIVGDNLMLAYPVRVEVEQEYGNHSLYFTKIEMNKNYRLGSILCYFATIVLTLLASLVAVKLAIIIFIVLILVIFITSRRKVYEY